MEKHLISTLRSTKTFLITIFIILTFINCIWMKSASALIGIKEGDSAKEILLDSVQGESVSLKSYLGKKPVVLVFWKITTNKAFIDYSLDMLRFLNDFYAKYNKSEGLEILAIYIPHEFDNVTDDETNAVINIAKTNNIQYPVLIDRGFRFFREYGIIALPSTVMIGKTGTIDFIYSSFPLSARPVISGRIQELVGVAESDEKKRESKKIITATKSSRLYNYALQMFKRGLLEQSLSALTKSLELNPDDSWSHNLKGVILWKKGLLDLARREFMAAIRIDETNVAPHINSAVLLIAEGKYDEAEKILITSPDAENDLKIRAHQLLGMVYAKTNRVDKAIRELETAADIVDRTSNENNVMVTSPFTSEISISHDLSVLYAKKGDRINAQKMLNKALHEALGIEGSFADQHLEHRDLMLYE